MPMSLRLKTPGSLDFPAGTKTMKDDPSMPMAKSLKLPAKTMKGDPSMVMDKNASGSSEFFTGTKKIKGSADASASAKSKQTIKSKEVTKGKSQAGKASQKSLPSIKMGRSSLPESSEIAGEHAHEQTDTLSSAKADASSASVYGISGAFIVAMCFLVGGALIAT